MTTSHAPVQLAHRKFQVRAASAVVALMLAVGGFLVGRADRASSAGQSTATVVTHATFDELGLCVPTGTPIRNC